MPPPRTLYFLVFCEVERLDDGRRVSRGSITSSIIAVARGDVDVDDLAEGLDQLRLRRGGVLGRLDLLRTMTISTAPSAPITLISALGQATMRSGS